MALASSGGDPRGGAFGGERGKDGETHQRHLLTRKQVLRSDDEGKKENSKSRVH